MKKRVIGCAAMALALGIGLGLKPVSAEDVQLKERVLTQQEQQALTPDQALDILKRGNKRFMGGNLTQRDHSKQVRDAVSGQWPKAVILSCLDARIPVEDVFDRGIGDVFVARVAGNFANTDIIGSMEFACHVSGAKVVLVLGHGRCGAVVGAINRVELGNLTATLANISPAVAASEAVYQGKKTADNPEFVELVTETNVRLAMDKIRQQSPILREMEKKGEIRIVGAMYNIATGEVEFLD